MIDPSSRQYRNGRAFGDGYSAQYGLESLLRAIAGDIKCTGRYAAPTYDYIAGEIDAALWVVSASEVRHGV